MKVPPWQIKFWQMPHLGDLELMHASNITHEYPRHIHEEYSIAIVLRGQETHICRGKSYKASRGSLMLLNPDEAHTSKSVGTEYRVIHIPSNTLNQIAFDVDGRDVETLYFTDPVIEDPSMFRSLLDLHLKLEQNASPLEQESELVSTIGLLIGRQNETRSTLRPPGREPHGIKRVQDYLKLHYAQNITLAHLASVANLSPFHLIRVFRNQIGVPPHEYQTQLRITHAGKLIRNGQSISEAAHETGFFDQSHLSRNFKRITGMTPGFYLSQSNIVQDKANRSD